MQTKRHRRYFLFGLAAHLATLATLWSCADGATCDVMKPPELYGRLKQGDLGYWYGPQFACGPTSVANSFAYLQRMYPQRFQTDLIDDTNDNGIIDYAELKHVAEQLAKYMRTKTARGTTPEMLAYGKWIYVRRNARNTMSYSARSAEPWTDRPGLYMPKPKWYLDNTPPTWSFLQSQLKRCEDVEVLIKTLDGKAGHWVTVTGLTWDDELDDGSLHIRDPIDGCDYEIDMWKDPGGLLYTDYLAGQHTKITAAISESPRRVWCWNHLWDLLTRVVLGPLWHSPEPETFSDLWVFPDVQIDVAYTPWSTAEGWEWEYVQESPDGASHESLGIHWWGPELGPDSLSDFWFRTVDIPAQEYSTWVHDSTANETFFEWVPCYEIPDPLTVTGIALSMPALVFYLWRRVRANLVRASDRQ